MGEYGQRAAHNPAQNDGPANARVQPLEFKLVQAATITGRVNISMVFRWRMFRYKYIGRAMPPTDAGI
jgi:hypothetical protein